MIGEEGFDVIGLQTRWGVEEVKDFGRRLDPVLGGHFRVDEAIVLRTHKVLEARSAIRQLIRVGHVCQKGLLGEAQLHFRAEEGRVVEVGH